MERENKQPGGDIGLTTWRRETKDKDDLISNLRDPRGNFLRSSLEGGFTMGSN